MLTLSSGATVPYDYLILCTGTQYQKPVSLSAATEATVSGMAMKEPLNLFILSDEIDAVRLVDYIKSHKFDENGMMVIYVS